MEDEEILDLFFARDEQAIGQTDRKYGGALRSLSKRITGSGQDAEECVDDTYMQAWKTIPPQRPSHFYAFLVSVTRNLSLNRLKAEKRQKRGGGLGAVLEELEELLPSEESVERGLTDGEILKTVEAFLEEADADLRYAFLSRYYLGESVLSIAAKTGRTPTGVSVLLHRARKELKRRLEKEGIRP